MENKEPLCLKCARRGKTCCQMCEIYVTPGDVERIQMFTGRHDFYEFRLPQNPRYLDQDDDPEWARCVFRPDGSRRVLRRTESGDCVFLGTCGCQLPWEVRPLVCRLYPVEYTATGLKTDLADGCPVDLLPPGQDLLSALGMTWAQAEVWHRQLYAEIRMEPHLLTNGPTELERIQTLRLDRPGQEASIPGGLSRPPMPMPAGTPANSPAGTQPCGAGKTASYPQSMPKVA